MIRIFICLVVIASSFGTCFAQAEKESQLLIDLHKKKFSWLVDKNYDSLQVLLDEKLLYIHSNGLTETKADVFSNLKSEVISYTRSDVTEAQVRFFGNSAVITGKGAFAGKARGTPFELNLVYTEVYSKVNNKWRLVSRHACRV
jgi:hypothetical protein